MWDANLGQRKDEKEGLKDTHESERQKILGHPGDQIGTTERPSGHN